MSDWVSTTSYVYVLFRIEFLISTVFVENFMASMSGIPSRFLHVLNSYSCKLDYCNILAFPVLKPSTGVLPVRKKNQSLPLHFWDFLRISSCWKRNRGIPTRAWKPSARNGHLNLDLLVMIPPSPETDQNDARMTCARGTGVFVLLGTVPP